jgi:Kef-type K+ transport system membrane component KefB/mannitol/fructose-specific phosphotransferase system IIA component
MLSTASPLLVLGVVLVAGVLFGALAARIRIPAVTGQILAGVILGPSVLRLFDHATVEGLTPVTEFALGLIAVAVGNHLHFRRLRAAARRLVLLVVLEVTITPLVVFVAIFYLPNTDWVFAALLAAMAISTAPATIVALVKETRSKGVFVRTLVAAVALNNLACICLFEVAHTAARAALDPSIPGDLLTVVMAPFRQLFASAALGLGSGVALILATRRVVRSDRVATLSLLAILLTVGFSQYLGVSILLSCIFLGVALANITPDRDEIGHRVFSNFESAIFAVFFTLAGLELDFAYLVPGGTIALVLVASRIVGKVLATHLAMRWAGATERVQKYLGLALVPQAGVAVGLLLVVDQDPVFAPIRDLFLAVGLSAVLANEIVGPILTRFALIRSGDYGKDRARLIDFLQEEHIAVGLEATSKEQVIEKLTDFLIDSHHLKVDRGALLASILGREAVLTTCVGGGLAVPHGELPEGQRMVGVMGLSRRGLRFNTPDGQPVHCLVLLATPPSERGRHLEVLAALARILADRRVQAELYVAPTAAHAYEVLHADEVVDINYFLDDEGPPSGTDGIAVPAARVR